MSFVKEARLVCRGCWGGLAAGYAYNAEDSEFGKGTAGYEDAVGCGVQVGRSDLDAVVEEREKVVGDDAFDGFAIGVAQADPEAVELGAAEEGFAHGLEVVGKIADEVDGADSGQGEFLVLAVGSEEIDWIGLAEARRV